VVLSVKDDNKYSDTFQSINTTLFNISMGANFNINRYLKKIKLPRLIVIKNWCRKILEGVAYLHS